MNTLKWITFTAVLIGALNWGLVGLFHFDLVRFIFGDMTVLTRIIYSLVGLCALTYFVIAMRENSECSHYNC